MGVELTCPVVRAVDQEGSKTDVVAELVGSQEGVLEERCTDAVSLYASIDGKPYDIRQETRNGISRITLE